MSSPPFVAVPTFRCMWKAHRGTLHRFTARDLPDCNRGGANAFRHAHAGRIGVEIPYSQRQLRLRFRDNGKPSTRRSSTETGRTGTTACLAMQERARAVGGKLAVWSELDSGTEAGLTIPASIA